MTGNYLDKQKAITMCNEMLMFLEQDDVVYSLRETITGINIHVELDHSIGEFSTFTMFKTYSTIQGNEATQVTLLKPPRMSMAKSPARPRSSDNKSSSMRKSSSVETIHHGWKRLQLKRNQIKKTYSTETIDCGQRRSFKLRPSEKRRNKVCRAATITEGESVPYRNDLVSSTETVDIVVSNEQSLSFNSFDEQDRKELESLRKGTKKVSWFSTNVQEKTKKLCKLLKIMNFKKLGDKTERFFQNEETVSDFLHISFSISKQMRPSGLWDRGGQLCCSSLQILRG